MPQPLKHYVVGVFAGVAIAIGLDHAALHGWSCLSFPYSFCVTAAGAAVVFWLSGAQT